MVESAAGWQDRFFVEGAKGTTRLLDSKPKSPKYPRAIFGRRAD